MKNIQELKRVYIRLDDEDLKQVQKVIEDVKDMTEWELKVHICQKLFGYTPVKADRVSAIKTLKVENDSLKEEVAKLQAKLAKRKG